MRSPTSRPRATVILTQVAFLWVTMAIASTALWPIYESTAVIVVVVAGLLAATVLAVAGAWFRWPAWVVLLATVAVFLAIGVPVAVPGRANGILPTLEGLRDLVAGVALGWKQLLTITLPVADYEALLVPAFVLVLGLGTLGLSVALRTRAGELAVIAPLALFVTAIAFGPDREPAVSIAAPVALTVTVLLWLAWFRWHRRREAIRALTDHAAPREGIAAVRAGLAAALVAVVAATAAIGAALALPPSQDRTVLRSSIEQPFDPRQFVSPLSGFRAYWQEPAVEEVQLTVAGVGDGDRIRIATMDTYDGVVFSVGSGAVSSASGSFVRVPSTVDPAGIDGEPVQARIALDAYRGVWVPTVGMLHSVTFAGPDASARRDGFYYNGVTGTAAVLGGVAAPDEYTLDALRPEQPEESAWAALEPGSAVVPAATGVPEEVAATLERWTTGVEGAGARLVAMLDGIALEGYISHGVDEDEPPSRSGHSADRLAELLTAPRMIGDGEQYATLAALMARELGFPSRVVMGFVADDGVVRGGDVSAWIEISTAQYGWVAIDPLPPFREIPEELPEENSQVARPPTIVPPPVVESETIDRQTTPDSQQDAPPDLDAALQVILLVLRVVGWVLFVAAVLMAPFLVVIAAKLRRRRLRRRAPTPAERISGGWREFRDTVVDHGLAPDPSATRTEVAAVAGRTQALVLAAVADRAVFGPEPPSPTEADSVWRAVDDLRLSLDEDRTRWERIRARVSLRSLGGYSVSRFFRRESRS